jgi:probable HAF family extracellular repeat protein
VHLIWGFAMRKVPSLLASLVVVVPLVAALGAGPAQASGGGPAIQPLVLVHDLQYPEVDGLSTAGAVNASGQVAGESRQGNGTFGYITDPSNAGATRLDALTQLAEQPESWAVALNDAGVAAGFSLLDVIDDTGSPLAVVWGSANSPTSLGTIGNRPCTPPDPFDVDCDTSNATGINNTGTAVGVSDRDDGSGGRIHHAFADALATLTMTDLGTLAGGSNSAATGVNDAGIVVGNSETTDGGAGLTTHAFIADLSTLTMTDLGTLAGGTSSGATAINAHGLVVGNSTVTGGVNHPFTYDLATHTMTDLGLPPGATSAGATAVNGDGLVVGDSDVGPWVYDPTSETFALIPNAETATGINDSGEIVGVGQLPDPANASNIVTGPYRTFVELSAPDPVTNVHIPTACGRAPTVRWSASAPKPYAPAEAYVVFRNGTMIATVHGTTFTDTSAIAPATYTVAASDLVGLSVVSGGATWTCLPGITGTVTAGGSPIGGVAVRVFHADTTALAARAVTDPDGHYGLPGLPVGSYNVRFSSPAGLVVPAWNGGATTHAAAAPVVVTAGATTTVDADLVAAAAFSGTVVGEGNPRSGIDVRVYVAGTHTLAAKAVTAADGTYLVGGLLPGSYQVRFSSGDLGFATQWAVGATTQALATTFTLAGRTTTIVDATLV